jgi:hypothetical protein
MSEEKVQRLYVGECFESIEPITLEDLLEYVDKGMIVPMREISLEEAKKIWPSKDEAK